MKKTILFADEIEKKVSKITIDEHVEVIMFGESISIHDQVNPSKLSHKRYSATHGKTGARVGIACDSIEEMRATVVSLIRNRGKNRLFEAIKKAQEIIQSWN